MNNFITSGIQLPTTMAHLKAWSDFVF